MLPMPKSHDPMASMSSRGDDRVLSTEFADSNTVINDDSSIDDKEGDVQDNINARVESLFPTFTSSDTLLQHEMIELLSDLGIEVTLAALQAYSNEDEYDLETAQEIAQHFFVALRNVNVAHSSSTTVVHQGVIDYVKTAVLCRRLPRHEYKVVWPKFEYQLSPRKILLGGTGVVMLITGMLVIATVSLLWVDTETKREKKNSKSLGETVLSFSSLFERNWVELAGKEAASETDVFTQYKNRRAQVEEQLHLKKAETIAKFMETGHNFGFNDNVHRRKILHMQGQFQSIVKLTELLTPSRKSNADISKVNARILPIIRSWETNEWDLVATATNGTLLEGAKQKCEATNTTGCTYQLDCLKNTVPLKVNMFEQTTDVHNRASQAVSVFLPSLNMQVCALFLQSGIREAAIVEANTIKAYAEKDIERFEFEVATVRATSKNAINNPDLVWNHSISSQLFTAATCFNHVDSTACRDMDTVIGNAIVKRVLNTTVLVSRSDHSSICSFVPTTYETAFVVCSSEELFTKHLIDQIVETINYLNFKFTRTTEIVASTINRTTDVVTAQVTAFRFTEGCYGSCRRTAASSVNAETALRTGTTGFSITPDYRPEPVIGGFSYSPFLDVAVLIERDVHEIRDRASNTLIAILDEVNGRMQDVEVLAVRPVNYPPIKTFDPNAPCPEQCTTVDGLGVVFRADCKHCERLLDDSISTLNFLTELKDPGNKCARNGGPTNCTNEYLSQYDVYSLPFQFKDTNIDDRTYEPGVYTGYTTEQMLSGYFYIDNITLGVVVQWPVSTYERPILVIVGLSVGVACLFVITALVILMWQSRKYLDDIEEEWSNYKRQISEENEKFAETVIEVLPAKVAQRLMKRQVAIAETLSLSQMFIGFAGFQRFIAGWEPQLLGQYTSYFFYLVTTVTLHYKIHKVRTIGDMTFVAGGIQDDRDGESLSKATVRTVQAAAVILQLSSFLYIHSPPKVAQLKNVAVTEKISDLCQLRVGIHFGPCTMHVAQGVSSTPNFDCVGPNVSMAWKLHQLAKASTINVSNAVKESMERRDVLDSYKFEKARNVMHKKMVLQASLITHADVAVPPSVLQTLAIRRSNPRTYFVDGGLSYQSPDAPNKRMTSNTTMSQSQASFATPSDQGDRNSQS